MPVKLCCCVCERPMTALHRTKEVNTRNLFPDLCESCASKLDQTARLAKEQWFKQIDITSRNALINAARRELLNTKG